MQVLCAKVIWFLRGFLGVSAPSPSKLGRDHRTLKGILGPPFSEIATSVAISRPSLGTLSGEGVITRSDGTNAVGLIWRSYEKRCIVPTCVLRFISMA